MLQINSEDKEFVSHLITEVKLNDTGWTLTFDDGFSLFCPNELCKESPKVGEPIRLYGPGLGFVVRGIVIADRIYRYETSEESKESQEIEQYGADAADWLKRWDDGRSVWSISMGGLGPGYEQCIQITAAEILRFMLDKKYDVSFWEDKEIWEHDRDEIEKMSFNNPTIKALGLSGAQWGAAMNLAGFLYRYGPRGVMRDERVKDRHIQISKNFPGNSGSDRGD